jgi:transcription elongation factor GreA
MKEVEVVNLKNGKPYFTERGKEKLKQDISKLEQKLQDIQANTANVAELGGNQWHDNASFERLTEDIRGLRVRIAKARDLMTRAIIVKPPDNLDKVAIGTSVKVLFNGTEEVWQIVGYGESEPNSNLFAYNVPVAALIIGRREGEVVSGPVGRGNAEIKIIEISDGAVEDVCSP